MGGPGTTAGATPAGQGRLIGHPGRHVRVVAFSSGGFDTAMHLGVVHAMLVAQARAPDLVAGVSAGAINAAALAEVLQAGDLVPSRPSA